METLSYHRPWPLLGLLLFLLASLALAEEMDGYFTSQGEYSNGGKSSKGIKSSKSSKSSKSKGLTSETPCVDEKGKLGKGGYRRNERHLLPSTVKTIERRLLDNEDEDHPSYPFRRRRLEKERIENQDIEIDDPTGAHYSRYSSYKEGNSASKNGIDINYHEDATKRGKGGEGSSGTTGSKRSETGRSNSDDECDERPPQLPESCPSAFPSVVPSAPPPLRAPNQVCSDAISVVPDSGSVSGSTDTATFSGVIGCNSETIAPDIWYRVAGTGTLLIASLCGAMTTYDSQIAVYRAAGDDCTLSCIISNDQFPECGDASQVKFDTDLGVTYFIQVYGYDSSVGSFELTVSTEIPSPNNDCIGAISVVPDSGPVFGSTVLASFSGANGCGSGSVAPDLWYSVAGTGSLLTASLCGANTTYDSQIAVYRAAPDDLTFSCIISNDDFQDCNFASLASQVTFDTDPGVTYFIQVYGFGVSVGSFELTVSTAIPSPNNDCIGAISVVPDSGPVFGSTVLATFSGVNGCNSETIASDLWYSVAGTGSLLTASLCGDTTLYDSQIAVYRAAGDDCTLECIISNDQSEECGNASQVTFDTDPGVTYFIQVYGFDGSVGSFELTVSTTIPPPL